MAFEVENKYAVADRHELVRRLKELGARESVTESQADFYLRHPDRDFRQTDEALRIRQVGDAVTITYKGPRAATSVKIREEIELVVVAPRSASLSDTLVLFDRLGFRLVAEIRKQRTNYLLSAGERDITICLDEVAGLGVFAEIELVAEAEQIDSASAFVSALAVRLNLHSPITASYLKMHLERESPADPLDLGS